MAKPLFEVISTAKLRQRAGNPGPKDAIGILAKNVIEILDARGPIDAEAAFCEVMRDYFYNLAGASKRRHADALALAFCEDRAGFDELWEYLKDADVTGRTYTRPKT